MRILLPAWVSLSAFAIAAIAIVAFVVAVGACSNLLPVEPPPPPVKPAPAEVAGLAIYVYELVQPPVTPKDEWDYHHASGYTGQLREHFKTQLQAAGYTVILDRITPADLVATIQSDIPLEGPGVATLVLESGETSVDRMSVAVPISGEFPDSVYHLAEAAVRLVEAMSRSPRVAAFAHDRPPLPVGLSTAVAKPSPAPSSSVVAVAADPCPPTGETLPPEPEAPQEECIVERAVACRPPSPVRSAWQPPPFVQCPPEIESFTDDVLRLPGRFSALETRARRLDGACGETPASGECCYVQHTAQTCR